MRTSADGRSENYGGCVVIQHFFRNIFCFYFKIIFVPIRKIWVSELGIGKYFQIDTPS